MGVNTDDDEDDYREKLGKFGVTWIDAWGGKTICRKFGVTSFPTVAILDETGRVVTMGARGASLEKAVEKALAGLKQRKRGDAGQ